MRKAFICPSKYIQGEDEILNLGYFVRDFGTSALLVAHPDDVNRQKEKLDATARRFDVRFVESAFWGECSRQEIARLETIAERFKCDCVIGLGGGLNRRWCAVDGMMPRQNRSHQPPMCH